MKYHHHLDMDSKTIRRLMGDMIQLQDNHPFWESLDGLATPELLANYANVALGVRRIIAFNAEDVRHLSQLCKILSITEAEVSDGEEAPYCDATVIVALYHYICFAWTLPDEIIFRVHDRRIPSQVLTSEHFRPPLVYNLPQANVAYLYGSGSHFGLLYVKVPSKVSGIEAPDALEVGKFDGKRGSVINGMASKGLSAATS